MMYFLIHDAAKNRSMDIIKQFEEKESNIEDPDEYGETPLHHAVYFGHSELVKYLISKNVNVKVRDSIGSTALHRACWQGNMNMVIYLKNNNADLEAKDDFGRTPLHFAVMNGQLEIVKYLEENEANLIVYDGYGNSLLDLANVEKRNDLVQYLRERSYDNESNYFQLPLCLALVSNMDNVIKSMFDERMLCKITSLRGVHLLNHPVELECSHAVCLRCIFDIMGQVYLDKMKSSEKASCCFKNVAELQLKDILYDNEYDFYRETVCFNSKIFATDLLKCLGITMDLLKNKCTEELKKFDYYEDDILTRIESLKTTFEKVFKSLDKIRSKFKEYIKSCKNKECLMEDILYWRQFTKKGLMKSFQINEKYILKKDVGSLKLSPFPIPGYRIDKNELKLQENKFFLTLFDKYKKRIEKKYEHNNASNN